MAVIIMGLLGIAAAQAATPASPITQTVQSAPVATGAPLWRDLKAGMTAEQAAAVLRAIEGVKAVQIVRKKNKPPRLDISYTGSAIEVGVLKVIIATIFDGELLKEVTLKADECGSVGVEQAKTTAMALKEKYGSSAREKVVDDNGVFIEYRFAFWNEATRVRMSWSEYNPANVGSSGAGGTLGQIADIFGAIGANSAQAACPTDNGARLTTILTYSPQSDFNSSQQASSSKKGAEQKATKDGL